MSLEDKITKKWLQDNPYDLNSSLPKGWEVRFGMRGRFMKYDSIEHAERKNMITIRETGIQMPFGYCNKQWENLKNNYTPGDEIWIMGNTGTMILLSRNGELFTEQCGKYKVLKNGYYIALSCV